MTTSKVTILAGGLLAGLAFAQPEHRYQVTDLGTLGGGYSYSYGINNEGMIVGGSAKPGQTDGFAQTGFVWSRGKLTGLASLGGQACPGCSSQAAAVTPNGDIVGFSETGLPAPDGEDFCEFGTHMQCRAAVWKNGTVTALPSLPGGYNSAAYWMNSKGEAVGFSENGALDSTCTLPFQKYRYSAVKWSQDGRIQALRPLPGDTVSFAFGINDSGQVVGVSGLCSNVTLPPFLDPNGPHAVLWEKDGTPAEIQSLKGVATTVPTGINNRGDVAGNLRYEDGSVHAFLWTRRIGMEDLGVPDPAVDAVSVAPCCGTINNSGDIVGFSCPGPQGSCRAILYADHKWQDLNKLTLPGSAYMTSANSINDSGQIAASGMTAAGDPRAYLMSFSKTSASAGPKDLTVLARSVRLDGTQSTSVDGKGLTYLWTIPQGYPIAAITDATTATPTVMFSMTRGVYQFQLTVTDANGATSTDLATVNFQGN